MGRVLLILPAELLLTWWIIQYTEDGHIITVFFVVFDICPATTFTTRWRTFPLLHKMSMCSGVANLCQTSILALGNRLSLTQYLSDSSTLFLLRTYTELSVKFEWRVHLRRPRVEVCIVIHPAATESREKSSNRGLIWFPHFASYFGQLLNQLATFQKNVLLTWSKLTLIYVLP